MPVDTTATNALFDQPTLWRTEAALALGLRGEARIAALSPGAAFPAALRSVLAALPARTRTIVDLGAGACGASEWLRTSTGATVYAIEPARGALLAARLAFPELRIIHGRADQTPLPGRFAEAVTMCGVLSLIHELDQVLDEVLRLLVPNGVFAIADLFANGDRTIVSGLNIFRSLESVRDRLGERGLVVIEVGCGAAAPHPVWAEVSDRVDAWIDEHCSDRPGYTEWTADKRHLNAHISAGDVLGGCLVATRQPTGRRYGLST